MAWGSTVGYIADRNNRGDLAAERHSVGCDTEEVVERAALVRFVM